MSFGEVIHYYGRHRARPAPWQKQAPSILNLANQKKTDSIHIPEGNTEL